MTVSTIVRDIIRVPVQILNQPVIKEGVKTATGSLTFAFGVFELYDVFQERESWSITVDKIPSFCAKSSLILSAAVSRIGILIISTLVGYAFSSEQLARAFGPNTIFAINPWHPRHVASIVAVILALPSIAISTYHGFNWACRKVCDYNKEIDLKIQIMVFFNTVFSRFTLHVVNQFAQSTLRRA